MNEHSLTLRLGGRMFALPLLRTRQILPFPTVTRVPATPSYIVGVFNLVGRVVPLLDLAAKLGLGTTSFDDASYVVVADVTLDGEDSVVGILTETVGEVLDDDAAERLDLDAVMEGR